MRKRICKHILSSCPYTVCPLQLALVAFEFLEVVAHPIDNTRTPVSCHKEYRRNCDFAKSEQAAHMSRTYECNRLDVRPLLRKSLREETAIAVSHKKHWQIILRF